MLAKHWKKICVLILIVACLFNIISKLVKKVSLNTELLTSARYVYTQNQENENKTK